MIKSFDRNKKTKMGKFALYSLIFLGRKDSLFLETVWPMLNKRIFFRNVQVSFSLVKQRTSFHLELAIV